MAGITGDPSWFVYGYEVSITWSKWVGIIVTVVAGYGSINISRNAGFRPMTFFTGDVLVYWMPFMRYLMAGKAVGASIEMRFNNSSLRDKRLARHVAALTYVFPGYKN